MTYRPASTQPRRRTARGWRNADYLRRRVSGPTAWRSAGIPADVAARLVTLDVSLPQGAALARMLSVEHLRALVVADRWLEPKDLSVVAVFREDVEAGRCWLGETGFALRTVLRLNRLGVDPHLAEAWRRRLSPFQRHTSLADVLSVASLMYAVPAEQYNDWLTFAEDHAVPFPGRASGWVFLGGETGALAAAGLSPAEADMLTRQGGLDLAALRAMAALRQASA